MKEKAFEEELQKWCEKACRYCYSLVQSGKVNLSFFAFQSEPRFKPEILILGLNPGNDYGFDKNKYPNFEETLKMFSKANAWFIEKDNWRLWRGINRVFTHAKLKTMLNQEDSFMYMNLLYFNTKRFNDFKRKYDPKEEIFEECTELTAELLSNIIKPRRIICLSINECYNRLVSSNSIVYIPSSLTRGEWNGIPVYGIRHTSYWNSAEPVVGKCLNYLFENESRLVPFEEINEKFKEEIELLKQVKIKLPDDTALNALEKLKESLDLKPVENNKSRLKINDELQVTLTNSEGGYLAIRHISYKEKYTADNKNYKFEKELKELLKEYGYEMSDVWLGRRKFNSFVNAKKDPINEIVENLGKLISEIQALYQPTEQLI